MIALIRPEVYMPIYGYPHMLHGNARNAYALGYPENRVIIGKNGQIMEFSEKDFRITEMFVPHRLITIDGEMIGYSKEDTLHERYQLSLNGTIAVSIAKKAGNYLIKTDTAGIPALHDIPKLEQRIEEELLKILSSQMQSFRDVDHLKKHLSKKAHDIIFEEIGKEPVVLITLF